MAVGIVGLGGTGAYVLDFVAKTPVREIHLYDGDHFLQHNAFRSPGAPSISELRKKHKKVDYLKHRYLPMRRKIFAHDFYVDASNVDHIKRLDFVFICIDNGLSKGIIIEKLEEWGTPFIDVGMGIELIDNHLIGVVRTTASTPEKRSHVRKMKRIGFSANDNDGVYSQNIQIADLNALNASLAVIKWKKIFGCYLDLENEHNATYTLDGNSIINEDYP